jgi:adenosine kinase
MRKTKDPPLDGGGSFFCKRNFPLVFFEGMSQSSRMNQKILVIGSIAYDRIMDYPGRFSDHILPEKIHSLSLSFLIHSIREGFGGTAGNVAYSLSCLGLPARIVASGGKDIDPYMRRLKGLGIDTVGLKKDAALPTAAAYVMTDKSNSQISGLHLGAMAKPAWPSLETLKKWKKDIAFATISATNVRDMERAFVDLPKAGIPYLLDAGQQIPALSPAALRKGIMGASVLTANDYEMVLISKKAKLSKAQMSKAVKVLVTTLGSRGSEIIADGVTYRIPSVRVKNAVDPTGAGDAYRAGIVAGIARGYSWETIGRLASIVGSYPVQYYGTQEHVFTWGDIKKKYSEYFKREL